MASPQEIRKGIDRNREYLGARYVHWNGVWPPNQRVFYDGRTKAPTPAEVKRDGILCSGELNLLDLLITGSSTNDAGTLWWERNLENRRPFDPNRVYPVGTVLGYPFARDNDGHVIVVSTEPDAQGRQWTIGADVPLGLSEQRTVLGAHKFFGLTYAGEMPGVGVIPLGKDPKLAGKTDKEKAEIIDRVFADIDGFPSVEYEPIGEVAMDVALNHTGPGNLWPSTAATVLEQESFGKNIFGADWGRIGRNVVPFARLPVTKERAKALVSKLRGDWSYANGIGPCQLTYPPFVFKAENLGGVHVVRNNLIVGFRHLNDLLNSYDYLSALEMYNDGTPARDPNNPYELQFAAKHLEWKRRFR